MFIIAAQGDWGRCDDLGRDNNWMDGVARSRDDGVETVVIVGGVVDCTDGAVRFV